MDDRILEVHVKPRARSASLVRWEDGSWRAQLTAPPVDGKANKELIELVARHFGVPRRAVSIKSGAASRIKRVRIAGG
ncbi:MAG: DUF167 domain-containing protein [Wenzhouxiangellaceae bacterium]|nr:DUF167 domain-containing protein [Wenzhouxiangellaceae bacterium]